MAGIHRNLSALSNASTISRTRLQPHLKATQQSSYSCRNTLSPEPFEPDSGLINKLKPKIDPNDTSRHYVFGYGSLINHKSRLRTFSEPTVAFPVSVKGLRRSWSYRCSRRHYTAVAVKRCSDPSVKTNGVLIPINHPVNDLALLDDREKDYVRSIISLDDIEFYSESHKQQLISPTLYGQRVVIWLYEDPTGHISTAKTHTPCIHCPIPQSYIDCMISGCLEFGIHFAQQFVASTDGWEGTWLDDRFASDALKKYVQRREIGEVLVDETRIIVDWLLESLLPYQYASRLRPAITDK
ncbi:hypothetical protein BDV3_004702 [Batrachochytrium dendrobatidis]